MQLKMVRPQQRRSTPQLLSINDNQQQLRKKTTVSLVSGLQKNTKKMQVSKIGVTDIIRSTMKFFVCRMCQNNVEITHTESIGECQHRFCIDCLIQYAIYKIKVHQEVLCPEEECKCKLNPNSQLFTQLPVQMQQKYRLYQLWKQTFNNPNIKLCPSETCKDGLVDLQKIPPQCQKCHIKYCKQCMMVTHEGPCDKNFEATFKQWKKCPKCSALIERTQGCNQMVCRCKHQFCFKCLLDWAPTHYFCDGPSNRRLCFDQVESMSRGQAIFYTISFILLMPVLFVVAFAFFAIGILLSVVIGLFGAVPLTITLAKDCCTTRVPAFLLCFLLLLPFILVISLIGGPILFCVTMWYPIVTSKTVQFCNTMKFLFQQLK